MTATLHRRLRHGFRTAAMRSIARCTFTGLALTEMKFANRVSMLSQSLIAPLLTRQAALCKFPTNRVPSSSTLPSLHVNCSYETSRLDSRRFARHYRTQCLAHRTPGHLRLHRSLRRRHHTFTGRSLGSDLSCLHSHIRHHPRFVLSPRYLGHSKVASGIDPEQLTHPPQIQ
jgi:hypothetical protein